MARFRNICFTINNPLIEEIQYVESLRDVEAYRREKGVRYIIYQTEEAEDSTRHIQGYCEFTTQLRRRAIQTILGGRVHIEGRRGTQKQAIDYCRKDDTRVDDESRGSGGTPKRLQKDSLKTVAEKIQEGHDLKELSNDYPVSFISHGPKIRSYALKLKGSRKTAPKIRIYFGKTGTGKSCRAMQQYPNAFWVPWPAKGGWWWSNYEGEEVVIFDEFRHQISLDEMLRLCDRYPYTVQEKGSSMNMVSTTLVFTTNIHPLEWYPNTAPSVKRPLYRRLRDYAKLFTFDDSSTWDNQVVDEENSSEVFAIN